ncbi:MAG: hypothetical protein LH480_02055 [Rubrivivax sp.]|nr:hypothetical protein [Rubrivivax sp.]
MVPSRQQARTLSRGLGWFSLGLGLVELLAAKPLSRSVGLRGDVTLMRAYGLREIFTGIGLLRAEDPTPFVWARVAGDALDMVTLAPGLRTGERRGAAVALAAVAGVTLLDLACARSLSSATKAAAVDYSRRSGWPLPADEMRGAALVDFTPPRDMSTPPALRPLGTAQVGGTDGTTGNVGAIAANAANSANGVDSLPGSSGTVQGAPAPDGLAAPAGRGA